MERGTEDGGFKDAPSSNDDSMQQSDQQCRPQPAQHQPQQTIPRISNPYSVKRSRTPVTSFSLNPVESLGMLETISSRDASKESRTLSHLSADPIDGNRKPPATTTAAANMTEPKSNSLDASTKTSTPFSTSDPRWKRLPSQTVTFGSAEILTVSELVQHAQHFCNRSVRVTGVLQHRHVHANQRYIPDESTTPFKGTGVYDGSPNVILVTLVLTDPLVPTKKKKRPRSSILSARRISFGKSPIVATTSLESSSKSNINLTSDVAFRTPNAKPSNTIMSTTTPKVFKTPATNKGENPNSLLLRSTTPATTPRFIGIKRPLSATSSVKTSLVDTVVDDLAEQLGIWIVVNPDHVPINDCAVGDLVMVIGEVRTMDEEDVMIGPDHEIRYMHNELVKRGQQHQQQEGKNTAFHVRARIVKNVNGTNMQLQQEALLLRRRALRAACSTSSDQSSGGNNEPLLRPGCGPPDNLMNNDKDNG